MINTFERYPTNKYLQPIHKVFVLSPLAFSVSKTRKSTHQDAWHTLDYVRSTIIEIKLLAQSLEKNWKKMKNEEKELRISPQCDALLSLFDKTCNIPKIDKP